MEVLNALSRALMFILIIMLGYILKRVGLFAKKDFLVLSRLVLYVTMPSVIISNFSRIEFDVSLFSATALGILANITLTTVGILLYFKKTRTEKAFASLNTSGYNIGNFAMPFVQSFLGPVGIAAVSLFDAGNAIMCNGLTYGIANTVIGSSSGIKLKSLVRQLFSSPPFLTYIIMSVVAISDFQMPQFVLSLTDTIGSANAFLAMFMLGIGFELNLDRGKRFDVVKILLGRYIGVSVLAFLVYTFLPYSQEIRAALVLVLYAPISGIAPTFTAKLGGDIGLASTVNAFSIIISIVAMTTAIVMLL